MPAWRTDDDLRDIATRLSHKIVEMCTDAGEWVPDHGGPGDNPRQVYTDSLVADAEDFAALDPQRIADEYFRIQRAARDTGRSGEARAGLEIAGARLATQWYGEAATAFAKQMSFIEVFMEQQQDQLVFAAQAMVMAYELSVEVRRSYWELADAAIAACDVEMGEQADREAKAVIGMGAEVVKAVVAALGSTGRHELLFSSLESLVGITAKGAEIQLEGSEAGAVVDNYVNARDALRRSWEEGLLEIRDWVARQEAELARDPVPLLEPLPATADVDSPDFRYEHFSNGNHGVAEFSPAVERHRAAVAEDERPGGVIARRLGAG